MHARATFLFVLFASLAATEVLAQEHPFLSNYTLTELPNGVLVNWTIQGGSTCDGQEVQRSSDSLNYVPIHTIQGICGSPDAITPYTWFDAAPPELSTFYYRIKLGFDGFSSVKSVFYGQLNSSDQRFYPDPAHDAAKLVLNVPLNMPVDLLVWNSQGTLVLQRTSMPGPELDVPVETLPAGPYIYRATTKAGRKFQGRFFKF